MTSFIFEYLILTHMSTLSSLRSMNPYKFERLVAKVWEARGYETTVRKRSNDKAVDVEAVSGSHKILIQVKRYAGNNKIGGPDVRNYATLYQQDPAADQVIIVTTSSFTSQAKEIAAEQNVTLVDGQSFIGMMKEQNIGLNKGRKSSSTKDRSSNLSTKDYLDADDVNKETLTLFAFAFSLFLGLIVSVPVAYFIAIPLGFIISDFRSVWYFLLVHSVIVYYMTRKIVEADT